MVLVAGVDTSTQSCTIVLRDADTGEVVGSASSPHPPTTPPVSEQEPAAWWEALRGAAGRIDHADLARVAAINVTGQAHGLVMLDETGTPLRAAKLWNDTTSAGEADALVDRLGPAAWAQRTGSVPVSAFTVSKIAWMARHEPERLHRARTILMPHDYLTYCLTGSMITDRSGASGTGYFSPATSRWDTSLLDLIDSTIDWASMLPDVLGPDDPAGPVTASGARALGLPPGTVVGPGSADNMAAALGLGLEPGDVVFSLGTSGVAYAVHDRPSNDATGAVNGNADASGRFLPVVCTLNAAKVTDTFARLLGVDHGRLAQLALEAPAGSDRPVLAAYLDGERVPNRPHATGLLAGLRTDTTREEIARAAFEGVLAGLVAGLEALQVNGVATHGRLILTGGASRSEAYRQLAADLAGRPVHVPLSADAAAEGSALQAAAVLSGEPVVDLARRWAPEYAVAAEPRPDTSSDALLDRYRTLAAFDGLG